MLGHRIHYRLTLRVNHGLAVRSNFLHLHGLNQFHRVVRFQILNDTLRDQHKSTYHAQWQEDPKVTADKIYPEIADRLHLATHDTTDKSDRQHNPHCRRHEVVIGETRHLGEIAHCRLARIVLPVGVCRERSCGVECQRRGIYGSELLGIEREIPLQAFHHVQHDHRDQAEQ